MAEDKEKERENETEEERKGREIIDWIETRAVEYACCDIRDRLIAIDESDHTDEEKLELKVKEGQKYLEHYPNRLYARARAIRDWRLEDDKKKEEKRKKEQEERERKEKEQAKEQAEAKGE